MSKNTKTIQQNLGLSTLDLLSSDERQLTIDDYIRAVSEYVLISSSISPEIKKAAQIRLSTVLGRALASALANTSPPIVNVQVGEREVAGALRIVQADVTQFHPLDGLRLAVELKPVNLAVGRAIWNRFGDIRTFAVNLHLKFPFAVIGGVLTIPTVEFDGSQQKSTTHLIERAVNRLIRAGGRRNEGDAAHLLEGVGVVVYDPNTASIHPDLPPDTSGLRWNDFIHALSTAYDSRFED
ncbi:MAG: hypothetical protein ACM3X6_12000 [Patescibacteria group bacterium]